ncbi:hypothetical protein MLD38_017856 [Melastoma candidum]|uniref:Uncharacterized protein n=1 Tax=Melastoma candidum TaxID=119954 RepID=A0ACB9QTW9_9MYRT|nr:hypothetical protein MLD38_017856 [Melastoma candidum]
MKRHPHPQQQQQQQYGGRFNRSYSQGTNGSNGYGVGNGKGNGLLPNSLKFISSCLRTASSGVRTARATVSASISGDSNEQKDQVLWSGFDKIELGPSSYKHVLLLAYINGFQVLDVEDSSNVSELVSRRDDPITFMQMQPLPVKSESCEGFRSSHPLLLLVACDESHSSGLMQNGRDGGNTSQSGSLPVPPTAVRFYSLRSHSYVHVLRFRSTVYVVRSSPRVVAVGLATQIYCFDALTLENKFSILTYPIPQLGGQLGINIGYGPMDVGPRWLAYASSGPFVSSNGRLSPQSLTPSPGVSPSTSPSGGSLVARYAVESSKQLAAGLINLSDMGYKTLSRYYQELIPDGSSSPVPSNSGWKHVRNHSHQTEADAAGMVVIKDFVSKAIVSQFRAHTSPISALCFDPSGTLLVTASVHGTNINIFRIMPCYSKTGSGSPAYDWSSSHVHLYKLHRGITSAVIQDICFSHYSQWVAIVSTKGTCHIFLLSPFGGETVLQLQNSQIGQPALLPVSSPPWWSTQSFMSYHQSPGQLSPPPPPVTLYVVSRIKNCNMGWLNTVTNATLSSPGKVSVPSGAIASVFYSCIMKNLQSSHPKVHALEHLLVYSPSGHVIQYELLPPVGGDSAGAISRNVPVSSMTVQDEEPHIKVDPLQWWDVCRRTDWPEREEFLSGITLVRQPSNIVLDVFESEDICHGDRDSGKPSERSHLYLANAEIQMSIGRMPIWQHTEIHFHAISSVSAEELINVQGSPAGEIEVEKIPANEIEVRRKDLLPVFEHFQRNHHVWGERGHESGPHFPPFTGTPKGKSSDDGLLPYPKVASSTEQPDGSSEHFYPTMAQSGEKNHLLKPGCHDLLSLPLQQTSVNKDRILVSPEHYMLSSPGKGINYPNAGPTVANGSVSSERSIVEDFQPSNCGGASDLSNTISNRSDSSVNNNEEGLAHGSLDFEPYFQEGYCQTATAHESRDSVKAVGIGDNVGSPHGQDKSEEDVDNDDTPEGIFAFSEEG